MINFKFADIGEGLESGKVIEVLVKEGQKVEEGDDLFSVETEKVNTEIGAPADGIITKIYIKNGEEISVGQVVMDIDDGAGDSAAAPAEAPAPAATPTPAPEEAAEPEAEAEEGGGGASVVGEVTISDELLPSRAPEPPVVPAAAPAVAEAKLTPLAAKMVADQKIDISGIKGTGPGGAITTSDLPLPTAQPSVAPPAPTPAAPAPTPAAPAPSANAPARDVKVSPFVRRYASSKNVNLALLSGTGPEGRILQADIDRYLAAQVPPAPAPTPPPPPPPPAPTPTAAPAPAPAAQPAGVVPPSVAPQIIRTGELYTYQKMSGVRKATAKHMVLSKRTIPETTLMLSVEASNLIHLRTELKPIAASRNIKLTYLSFIVKACAVALRKYPMINSSLDDEKDTIIIKNFCNIGIAVDSPTGLMVPVIKDADVKTISSIAAEIIDLANKVRNRTIKMAEMRDGTFTISNYGSVGIEYGTPVINYPEAAILGVGTITKEPIVNAAGEIVPGAKLPLSLTIDHRIIDGADGGRFMTEIKKILEEPEILLF